MAKWEEAIVEVLNRHNGGPMLATDIADEIVTAGLLTTKNKDSVNGALSHLVRDGVVERGARPGWFKLTASPSPITAPGSPADDKGDAATPFGLNLIFYGAPGTGKSRSARVITKEGGTSTNLPDYIREDKYVKTLPPSSKVFRTTFHPATNYASFVGSYKPCMNGTDIVYEFRPQVFLKAYMCACENPDEPVYLIIEEINRGQCAEIFGDLFQLLDRKNGVSEDPVEPDEDIKQYLKDKVPQKYWEHLILPANLYIIATMNTSDQSLFPMDSAFKRRWIWKNVKIDYDKIKDWSIDIAGQKYNWSKILKAINQYIRDQKKATDKQMGEFFVKSDDKVVGYEDFRDKVLFYLFNDVFKGNRGFKIGGIEYFEDLFEKEADKAEGEIIKWFTEELKLTLDTEQKEPTEVSESISTGDGTPGTVDEDASKSE